MMDLNRMKKLAGLLNESKLNEAPFGKKAENDPRNTRQLKAVIPEIQRTTSALESQIQNMLAKNTNQIMKKLEPLLQSFEWKDSNGKVNRVDKILDVSTFPKEMIERDIFENKMELDVRVRLSVRTENSVYQANFPLEKLLSYAKGKGFTNIGGESSI